jgi:hypothetical protein
MRTWGRWLIAALVLGLWATLVVVDRESSDPVSGVFSSPVEAASPSLSGSGVLSQMWVCPGVPASGLEGFGGEVIVVNTGETPVVGRVRILRAEGDPLERPLEVAAGEVLEIDVDEAVTTPFAGVVVETFDGRAVVEQRAHHPVGSALVPCASDTASQWYFADGSTAGGAYADYVLTNPGLAPAVVDVAFVSPTGARAPQALQGIVLDPQSTTVVRLGDEYGRDEAWLAVMIEATTGRFVAGRSQHYLGDGRLGYTMSLGISQPDDQWWFADGELGPGLIEQVSVLNPTNQDVVADIVALGIPLDELPTEPIQIQVPARSAARVDIGALGVLPEGRHGLSVSSFGQEALVVERAVTRPAGDFSVTAVVAGAHGASPSRVWYLGGAVPEETSEAIVVLNTTGVEVTVTVNDLGPGGEVAIDGYSAIELAPGAVLALDASEDLVGRPLVVRADAEVVVERSWPRRAGSEGRTGSLGIPG